MGTRVESTPKPMKDRKTNGEVRPGCACRSMIEMRGWRSLGNLPSGSALTRSTIMIHRQEHCTTPYLSENRKAKRNTNNVCNSFPLFQTDLHTHGHCRKKT